MLTITPRQREILDAYTALAEQHGRPPSIRELGRVLGVRWTNGVHKSVVALVKKGKIVLVAKGVHQFSSGTLRKQCP